jgi:hypothetical protein
MAKVTNGPLIQVTHWAVGRVPDASQVAMKLNDHSAFLMSVEEARHLSIALHHEADALGQLKPPPVRANAAASGRPTKK